MEFCHQLLIFKNSAFQNLNAATVNVERIMKLSPHEKRLKNQEKKCTNCKSFIIGNNNCEICDKVAASTLPNISIIDYSIPTPTLNTNKNMNIVFCIDISGSMGGDRLEHVKKACCDTIDSIISIDSSCRVTLITFESSTIYYGDGNSQENISNIPFYAYLAKKNKNLLPISQSIDALKTRINNLQASASATMCGALAESIAVGDVVILCTDGATSDKNEENYDQLIKFAKDNCVKINIIGFEGAEADLTGIQKFAYETNGIVSRSSSAIDLSNIFQNVAANVTSLSKFVTYFDLITNQNEFRLNGLTETSTHVVTNDLSREFIYEIQVLKPDCVVCIIQLQIHNPDRIRVVTQKLNVSDFDVKNTTHLQLNYDLLKVKDTSIISNMLFRDKNQFSEIERYIKTCNDLYTSLSRTPPEELDKYVKAIDAASKKGHQSTIYMKDVEFVEIYKQTTVKENNSYEMMKMLNETKPAFKHSDSEVNNKEYDTEKTSSNVIFEKIVKEHNQLECVLTEILNKNWKNIGILDDSSITQCIDEACDNIEREHQKRMITLILILLKIIKQIYIRFSGTIKGFSENKVESIPVSVASTPRRNSYSTIPSICQPSKQPTIDTNLQKGEKSFHEQTRSYSNSSDSENTLSPNFQQAVQKNITSVFTELSLSSNDNTFINELNLLRQPFEQINVILERIRSSGLISDFESIKSKYCELTKLVENYEFEIKKSFITDINDLTYTTGNIALEYIYKVNESATESNQSIINESSSESSSFYFKKSCSKINSKPKKVFSGSKRSCKKK